MKKNPGEPLGIRPPEKIWNSRKLITKNYLQILLQDATFFKISQQRWENYFSSSTAGMRASTSSTNTHDPFSRYIPSKIFTSGL